MRVQQRIFLGRNENNAGEARAKLLTTELTSTTTPSCWAVSGEEEGGEAEPPRNRPMEEMPEKRAIGAQVRVRKIGEVGSHFLRVEEMGGGEEERSKATGGK